VSALTIRILTCDGIDDGEVCDAVTADLVHTGLCWLVLSVALAAGWIWIRSVDKRKGRR
jgi:hypothetical protein